VDANVARGVARRIHAGQVTRIGEPLIDHLERVARAMPADSWALGYLHDALERSTGAADELRAHGCTDREFRLLALLTRRPSEPYRTYVMRIVRARGPEGRTARRIKLADLEDHLCHRQPGVSAPDYEWARQQILGAT
jgi:hypothetical protein